MSPSTSIEDLYHQRLSKSRAEKTPESLEECTDVGLHFRFNESSSILYSKEGNKLLENVEHVSPIKHHPRKAVVGVQMSIFGSTHKIKNYEVLTDNDGELISVYRIPSERDVEFNSNYEPIDFLPIPEYKKFCEIIDEVEESARPSLRFSTDKWVWKQDVRDSEECVCSTFNCDNKAEIRVRAEEGRSFGGYIIGSNEVIVNNYCRYCMDINPDSDVVKLYYNQDKKEDEESFDRCSVDKGYRKIAEDQLNKFRMIVSVSPEGTVENGLNEYFVTVELVHSDTGRLVDRETPTIHKPDPEEAADRAVDLYESFWSGIHGNDLSFETKESKLIK